MGVISAAHAADAITPNAATNVGPHFSLRQFNITRTIAHEPVNVRAQLATVASWTVRLLEGHVTRLRPTLQRRSHCGSSFLGATALPAGTPRSVPFEKEAGELVPRPRLRLYVTRITASCRTRGSTSAVRRARAECSHCH